MQNSVSAVLLNYRRPWNIPKIVESLAQYDFIKEVIVWDNDGTAYCDELTPTDSRFGDIVIHTRLENVGTYGRFLGVQRASHPIIYTQDDDHIVHNVADIYAAFLKYPDSITAALSLGHFQAEAGKKPWLQLGWGSMFAKDSVGCLSKWVAKYGEDDLLRSKADRIFSVLHDRHNPLVSDFTPLVNPDGVVSGRDKNSLWLQRDHLRLRDEAVAKALELRDEK